MSTDTDALVAFMRARLNEDEQVASAASPGPWSANAEHDEVLASDGITVADGFALSGHQLRATVDHIVHHDPARTLRRIEAVRRRLSMLAEAKVRVDAAAREQLAFESGMYFGKMTVLVDVVQADAQEYADHEDYQESWRP